MQLCIVYIVLIRRVYLSELLVYPKVTMTTNGRWAGGGVVGMKDLIRLF